MLELIGTDERLTLHGEDYEIYYRRIPGNVASNITRRNSKRGQTDNAGVADAMLNYAVLGWSGVTRDGVPVEFDRDLIEFLPAEVASKVIEKATEEVRSKEDEAKNS